MGSLSKRKVMAKEEEKDEKSEESRIAESTVLQKKEEEEENERAPSDDLEKSGNKDISKEFKSVENGNASSASKSDKDIYFEWIENHKAIITSC